MNRLIGSYLLVILLSVGCNTANNDKNKVSKQRLEFSVTEVHKQKNGLVIFMVDENEEKFITAVSVADGNFIELSEGDKISLIAESFSESNPVQITSKDIKIIKSESGYIPEYEKIEELTYWVSARRAVANDMDGNPVECLQFQTGKALDKEAAWEVVCDEIINFNYEEGNYYQIMVFKKWLKDHENLADRSPYDLEFKTVISKEVD